MAGGEEGYRSMLASPRALEVPWPLSHGGGYKPGYFLRWGEGCPPGRQLPLLTPGCRLFTALCIRQQRKQCLVSGAGPSSA